jgi:hypothetical protein
VAGRFPVKLRILLSALAMVVPLMTVVPVHAASASPTRCCDGDRGHHGDRDRSHDCDWWCHDGDREHRRDR